MEKFYLFMRFFVFLLDGGAAAHYLLGVVCDGSGTLECGGESYALARGTLFLVCKEAGFCVRGGASPLRYNNSENAHRRTWPSVRVCCFI